MENENNTKSTYIPVQRLFPFSTILGVSERGRGRLVRRREEEKIISTFAIKNTPCPTGRNCTLIQQTGKTIPKYIKKIFSTSILTFFATQTLQCYVTNTVFGYFV